MSVLSSLRRTAALAIVSPLAKALAEDSGLAASVVIATRNRATYLDLTLASLEYQIFPPDAWQVVVVDDDSTDATSSILAKYEQRQNLQLRWQSSKPHRGRAGARNDAVAIAQGKILVFLDDDRLVAPDFLSRHLIHHMNSSCVVYGDVNGRIHTHLAPHLDPTKWQLANLLYGQELKIPDGQESKPIISAEDLEAIENLQPLILSAMPPQEYFATVQAFDQQGFPWMQFTTGNSSVPREQVLAVGGFDENFQGWGFEDNDLALRLLRKGLPFRFEAEARSLHQVHALDATRSADHKRNMRYFFRKHQELDQSSIEPMFLSRVSDKQWIRHQQATAQKFHQRAWQRSSGKASDGLSLLWCVDGSNSIRASRDVVLIEELKKSHPAAHAHLVSYGPAAKWLRDCGLEVEELPTNAGNSPLLRFNAYTHYLQQLQPNLVVSDQELLILPLAQSCGIASAYLTDHIVEEEQDPQWSYAQCASQILCADLPGSFIVPPSLYDQTEFCGPWLADNPAPTHDAWRTLVDARGRPLIVIVSTDEPMVDRDFVSNAVVAALCQEPQPRVAVLESLQLGGSDRIPLPSEVLRLDLTPQTINLLQSADLVVTRSEHTLLWKLAAFGVPTVAVPTRSGFRGIDVTTDYALRSANRGNCLYMPEVLATSDYLQVAMHEILETPLGAKLRAATPQIDFACQRKEVVQQLLHLAHSAASLKRNQATVAPSTH